MSYRTLFLVLQYFSFAYVKFPQRVSLKDYPNARCNDGTPAIYYLKGGSDPQTWLVNLQGGGWCWGDDICAWRCSREGTTLCGSKNFPNGEFPSEINLGGIFDDRQENPVRGANKVFVMYCSSDGWMGRSNLGPLNYTFQGSYIVEAVIQDLISRFGLGEDPVRETTLIFGGQSAGARGAMVNIDFISNFVSSRTNARVIGWLDSPYWLPIDTVVDEISLLEQTRRVHAFANNTGILSKNCLQVYPKHPHYCMFGYYTMPFVKTRSIMESAIYDKFQLATIIGHYDVQTNEERELASNMAEQMTLEMKNLAEQNRQIMVFGPACCNHAVSHNDLFYEMVSDGINEAKILEYTLSAWPPYGQSDIFIDDCALDERAQLCCGHEKTSLRTCDGSITDLNERNDVPLWVFLTALLVGSAIISYVCFSHLKLTILERAAENAHNTSIQGSVSSPTFNGETIPAQPRRKRLIPTNTNKVKAEIGTSLRPPILRAPPRARLGTPIFKQSLPTQTVGPTPRRLRTPIIRHNVKPELGPSLRHTRLLRFPSQAPLSAPPALESVGADVVRQSSSSTLTPTFGTLTFGHITKLPALEKGD